MHDTLELLPNQRNAARGLAIAMIFLAFAVALIMELPLVSEGLDLRGEDGTHPLAVRVIALVAALYLSSKVTDAFAQWRGSSAIVEANESGISVFGCPPIKWEEFGGAHVRETLVFGLLPIKHFEVRIADPDSYWERQSILRQALRMGSRRRMVIPNMQLASRADEVAFEINSFASQTWMSRAQSHSF